MSSENDKIIRVNEFGNKKDTNNKTYDAVTKINGELTVLIDGLEIIVSKEGIKHFYEVAPIIVETDKIKVLK